MAGAQQVERPDRPTVCLRREAAQRLPRRQDGGSPRQYRLSAQKVLHV